MDQDDSTYSDIFTTSQIQDKRPRYEKRSVFTHNRLMTIISVLLILSVLTNAVLAYLYCKVEPAPYTLPLQTKKCSVGNKTSTEYQIEEKGTHYILSEDKLSWIASRERCQKLGGDLAIVNSQEEHEFLTRMVSTVGCSKQYWIGLTDADKEGVWLWVDQTPLNLSWWAYTPDDWKEHDPLGEDCVVYFAGKWGDVSCSYLNNRICEINCTAKTL